MFVVLSLPVTAFQYTHTAVQLGGSTNSRFFVEVPIDYNKPIPDGYEIAEIPPVHIFTLMVCRMMIPIIFPKRSGY